MADPSRRKTQLSDLPIDVLSSIADRICSFGDCVRFDSVIRRLVDGSSISSRQLEKLRNFPWLVIQVNETTKVLCFFSGRIFFPVHTQLPPETPSIHCIGSFFGWLSMADRYSTVNSGNGRHYLNSFLFNPCTNQRIQLPRMGIGGFPRVRIGFAKVVMSNADGGLLAAGGSGGLAFCRLGDEKWLRYSSTRFTCGDLIFFKGVLYLVDVYDCKIMAIHFRKAEDGGMQEHILPLKRHPKSRVHHGHYMKFFFVESDGELLLVVNEVVMCCRNEADHNNGCRCYNRAIRFCVLLIDFRGPSWVELTTLGNRMLLMDWACSVSLDAVKLTRFGFRPNCIYYTNHGEPDDDYGWHEFCLEDNKIVPFGCDFSTLLPLLPHE